MPAEHRLQNPDEKLGSYWSSEQQVENVSILGFILLLNQLGLEIQLAYTDLAVTPLDPKRERSS